MLRKVDSRRYTVDGLLKAWGKAVEGLCTGIVQPGRLTHSQNNGRGGWVQVYRLIQKLYYKSTQVFPLQNVNFLSVNRELYPLSTQPIKTATNYIYMKGL